MLDARMSHSGISITKLLFLAILGAGGYYLYSQGYVNPWLPEAYRANPASADSAPAVAPSQEKKLPLASDLKNLDPRHWPARVQLTKPVDFPVIKNGQQVGTVRDNPGNMVKLIELRGEKLLVENESQLRAEVPIGDTDMLKRVYGLMHLSGTAKTKAKDGQYLVPATELGRQLTEKEKF